MRAFILQAKTVPRRVVLERGGAVRGLDGPILDAALDAYVVGYPAAAGVLQ